MTRRAVAERFEREHADLAALPWDEHAEGWRVAERDGVGVWVVPLMFTSAVIVGRVSSLGYDDRWCYVDAMSALDAARVWGGPWNGGEPDGWHRHPASGRRRENGDAGREVRFS